MSGVTAKWKASSSPRATPENKTAQNFIYNNERFILNSTPFWYMPFGLLPLVAIV